MQYDLFIICHIIKEKREAKPAVNSTKKCYSRVVISEEKVVLDHLFLDLRSHTEQGVICAPELSAQGFQGIYSDLFHVKKILRTENMILVIILYLR